MSVWNREIDKGCTAAVGFGMPHTFRPSVLTGRALNGPTKTCNWGVILEKNPDARYDQWQYRIKFHMFKCTHYYYCERCHKSIPLNPRLCPLWRDRPDRFTPRTDVLTY